MELAEARQRLRSRREALPLTPAQAAERFGCTGEEFENWELGLCQPSLRTKEQWKTYLRWLYGLDSSKPGDRQLVLEAESIWEALRLAWWGELKEKTEARSDPRPVMLPSSATVRPLKEQLTGLLVVAFLLALATLVFTADARPPARVIQLTPLPDQTSPTLP